MLLPYQSLHIRTDCILCFSNCWSLLKPELILQGRFSKSWSSAVVTPGYVVPAVYRMSCCATLCLLPASCRDMSCCACCLLCVALYCPVLCLLPALRAILYCAVLCLLSALCYVAPMYSAPCCWLAQEYRRARTDCCSAMSLLAFGGTLGVDQEKLSCRREARMMLSTCRRHYKKLRSMLIVCHAGLKGFSQK